MNAISQTPPGVRDFRLLWLGEAISALGDQFALVALPWLALALTAAFGSVVMAILAFTGVGLAALATVHTLMLALGVTAAMGLATGYGNLMLITWAQQRIPQTLMGRVISLIGLVTMGLIPVSQVIAGAAVQLSLTAMLTVAGGSMALITLASIATGTVRGMGFVPTVGKLATADRIRNLEPCP